jgi:hypothetical protein
MRYKNQGENKTKNRVSKNRVSSCTSLSSFFYDVPWAERGGGRSWGPAGHCLLTKGPARKKSVTPVVGGWVRAQKKDRGQIFPPDFLMVFLNSPHRETLKNMINKNRQKPFDTIFLQKVFVVHESDVYLADGH